MSKSAYNRGRLEIMGEMMELIMTHGTINKTKLMQANNMSLEMINRYTGMMVQYGFIEAIERTRYRATEKGMYFFKWYARIREMIAPTVSYAS